MCGSVRLPPDGNDPNFCGLDGHADKGPAIIFQHLAHKTAVRFNRRIARPLLGRFVSESSYDSIRAAFDPTNVTAWDLSLDGSRLTPKDLACAAAILDWHGIVMLRNYTDRLLIGAAYCEAEAMTARLEKALTAPGNHGRTGNILWQVGGARFSGHRAILAQGQPLANLRSREPTTMNGGVIDLFFLDKAARENGWDALGICCAQLQQGAVAQIVAAVSRAKARQVNMLRSDSVTDTRGLHIGNLEGSYKAFLYLSDVRGTGDGPYAYVPGSHRRPDLLRREARLNGLKGRPESDSYAFEGYEMVFPAEKGTVIISCQSGVHRGLPQRMGASRTVLVGNFRA